MVLLYCYFVALILSNLVNLHQLVILINFSGFGKWNPHPMEVDFGWLSHIHSYRCLQI